MESNFTHIAAYDKALFRLSSNAERYFPGDPNTALIKLRQCGELLAQQVASRFGLYTGSKESQLELLRRLESNGDLECDIAELFHNLREAGNADNQHARVFEECGALSERALLAASELEPGVFQPQLSKELQARGLKQVDVDGEAAYSHAAWEEER